MKYAWYRSDAAETDGRTAMTTFVEDQSSNGTFVNDVRIERGKRVAIKDGDTLCVVRMPGQEQVAFRYRSLEAEVRKDKVQGCYVFGRTLGS